jgi:hypothetical protein
MMSAGQKKQPHSLCDGSHTHSLTAILVASQDCHRQPPGSAQWQARQALLTCVWSFALWIMHACYDHQAQLLLHDKHSALSSPVLTGWPWPLTHVCAGENSVQHLSA